MIKVTLKQKFPTHIQIRVENCVKINTNYDVTILRKTLSNSSRISSTKCSLLVCFARGMHVNKEKGMILDIWVQDEKKALFIHFCSFKFKL